MTNKSNFILTSLRRQQFYQRFCFKEAKSILKRLRQRYGKDPLKNACVAALSSSRPDRLTDVDKILELLDVNDETNGHSPFQNVLLWARRSGVYDTDHFNRLEEYLVRNGAGNIHDAIHHGCLQQVKERISAGLDLNCISQQTIPWENSCHVWQPLLHAIFIGQVDIVKYLLQNTNVDASSCRWNDGELVSTISAAKGNREILSVLIAHGAVPL